MAHAPHEHSNTSSFGELLLMSGKLNQSSSNSCLYASNQIPLPTFAVVNLVLHFRIYGKATTKRVRGACTLRADGAERRIGWWPQRK
jgi:hypothetical protein